VSERSLYSVRKLICQDTSAPSCKFNPFTPTVAIWVGYSYKASCVTLSDAQGWASECPDVKNYKWRLNPVWHRMLLFMQRWASKG